MESIGQSARILYIETLDVFPFLKYNVNSFFHITVNKLTNLHSGSLIESCLLSEYDSSWLIQNDFHLWTTIKLSYFKRLQMYKIIN